MKGGREEGRVGRRGGGGGYKGGRGRRGVPSRTVGLRNLGARRGVQSFPNHASRGLLDTRDKAGSVRGKASASVVVSSGSASGASKDRVQVPYSRHKRLAERLSIERKVKVYKFSSELKSWKSCTNGKVEKAALEKKAADEGKEGKEGKE